MREEVGTIQFLEFKGEHLKEKKVQKGCKLKNQNYKVKVS
jgi:hypothetical protein